MDPALITKYILLCKQIYYFYNQIHWAVWAASYFLSSRTRKQTCTKLSSYLRKNLRKSLYRHLTDFEMQISRKALLLYPIQLLGHTVPKNVHSIDLKLKLHWQSYIFYLATLCSVQDKYRGEQIPLRRLNGSVIAYSLAHMVDLKSLDESFSKV